MKIGIVCYPTIGGSGVVATELGKALAGRGHTVHFVTYDRPVRLRGYSGNIYYHEVAPVNYPLFKFVPYESALASKLVEIVCYHKLDVLHVHYAIPHASSAYLAQQILNLNCMFVPFITTLHGTDITLVGKDSAYEPVVSFSINQSNGVTSVSESLKQDTLRNFTINREIEVIPNFVEMEKFENSKPRLEFRNCLASEGERLLMHVSNFRPVKRVNDVYEIFKRVRERMPNVKLVLIGDGPERSPLERKVYGDALENDVVFLGNQQVVEDLLPLGDVFLFPSENESFGLAALEAMSCGLPVVGSNTGGIPELIDQGNSGFLANVGDVEAMASFALEILANDERLAAYKKQARERAKAFDLSKVVPAYESYYGKIIQETSHQKADVFSLQNKSN